GVPGAPAAAARRRRAPLRRADGRRAGCGPHLRAGHHPAGGRVVPGACERRRRERASGASPRTCRCFGRRSMMLGTTVTHRRYVPYGHAHYAGHLVDGAYALGLFGDVATELCIRTDGDEGLFAGYSEVRFVAPIRAGDVVEVTGSV